MQAKTLSLPVDEAVGLRLVEAVALSLLMGLAAQWEVRLAFTRVTITLQTLFVLFAGAALGPRWGSLSMALYLLEGACGLPFFAGGAAGPLWLLGPTGGYLMAFPPAAWLVGTLADRGWDETAAGSAAMMGLGSLVVFIGGLAGLARFVPAGALLRAGLLPFLPADIVKMGIAAALAPVWRGLKSHRG